MRSKKADRWIVLSLVTALVIQTILLLWHLGVITWQEKSQKGGQGPAGIISQNENELRRRSINSLVWEKSRHDETVYYYDSLLTLAQSTATVKLARDAEVKLAENTLVTIEPPEKSESGEIRLKVVRGNMQARNPWTDARIQAPDFVVDLKAGSEMQMRQTGDNQFEVQVQKGEALVHGSGGQHSLSPSQLLRVSGGVGEALSLDARLKWVSPPPSRVYSHSSTSDAYLRWEGEARELHLQRSGQPEQIIALSPAQRDVVLTLETGDHLAYLRSENSTSQPLPLQLWRAPLLHLITPLPRNRVRTHETTFFLWSRMPEISAYIFKIKGSKTNLEEPTSGNAHQVTFQQEDDAEWSVWGKDNAGFLIPPLYHYPLFIRDQPFAPPKLNAPRLRKPAQATEKGADKGAFFWLRQWILPTAHAADDARYEALFSWQPVEGADLYWLEISESADFRKPLVSTRLSKTEFVWREFRDRIYYWRVAAGHRSGRMGVFSEPAQVSVNEGVELRKIENVVAAEKPVVTAPAGEAVKTAPVEPAAVEPEPQPEIVIHEPRGLRVFWRGGYGLYQAQAERNVSASLQGPQMMAFAAEGDVRAGRDRWWTFEGKFSQSTFKPEPAQEYPYQKDVVLRNVEMRLSRVKASSPWGYGFSLAMAPKIERAGYEEIRAVSQVLGGAHLRGLVTGARTEYQGDLGLKAGAGEFGLSSAHRILFRPWGHRLLMGVGGEGVYLLQGSYNSLSVEGFLTLGFEF